MKFIIVPKRKNKNSVLMIKEILWLSRSRNYTFIQTLKELHYLKKSTDSLVTTLGEDFIRVHRSFVVNKAWISHIELNAVIVENYRIPIGMKYTKGLDRLIRANQVNSSIMQSINNKRVR